MADIKIMVDSGADMPDELREQYGIGLIPLLSVFGEKSYVIGRELSNEKFYDMLVNGDVHPKTSQTPYADMYDILLKESREHETVIYFTLSSLASGQNHSAQLVRDDISQLTKELYVRTTDKLITRWEKDFSLPYDASLTLQQRRQRILNKLARKKTLNWENLRLLIKNNILKPQFYIINNSGEYSFKIFLEEENISELKNAIDKAIKIVRETEEESEVVPNLMIGFGIDEIQAEYVAEIKLRNLNKEYILKRTQEIENLEKEIVVRNG